MSTVYVPDALIVTSLVLVGTPLLQFEATCQFDVPVVAPIQLLLAMLSPRRACRRGRWSASVRGQSLRSVNSP